MIEQGRGVEHQRALEHTERQAPTHVGGKSGVVFKKECQSRHHKHHVCHEHIQQCRTHICTEKSFHRFGYSPKIAKHTYESHAKPIKIQATSGRSL